MNSRTYITPDWTAPNTIRAYTSTRQNGFSEAPFDSFNIAKYVHDEPEQVDTNIQSLINDLQLPETPTWLHQMHSKKIVCIDDHKTPPKADASMTRKKNKVCAILTADCLPILVCNREGTEVAAIHAGWKGLLANIIGSSIQSLHASPDDLFVWLGPALGPDNFELGDSVHADFLNANPDYAIAFKRKNQRWYLDCYALAKMQLQHVGVNAIYGGGFCTFNDKKRFYSYRRDKGNTGRMVSLIFIEG